MASDSDTVTVTHTETVDLAAIEINFMVFADGEAQYRSPGGQYNTMQFTDVYNNNYIIYE